METSKNDRAKEIVWLRDGLGPNVMPFDTPEWLWYECPVHKGESWLEFSEYNWFLRCDSCDRDYPTCLCCWDDQDKAIDIYLSTVEYLIKDSKWK
jgi:hypothetical protein